MSPGLARRCFVIKGSYCVIRCQRVKGLKYYKLRPTTNNKAIRTADAVLRIVTYLVISLVQILMVLTLVLPKIINVNDEFTL